MASPDLTKELICSICLSLYKEPAMLECGHNFCRDCIEKTFNFQKGQKGEFFCPECQKRFGKRPDLKTNHKLQNIIEHLQPRNPDVGGASIRRCLVHKMPLEYYCSEDALCVCASCYQVGEHRGHQIELLHVVSENKKQKLRRSLDGFMSKREQTHEKLHRLQEHKEDVQAKVSGEVVRVTTLLNDIRKKLDVLEEVVINDISRQEQQILTAVTDLIQLLETKKEDLSKKIVHLEELCSLTNPVTLLQDKEQADFTILEEEDNVGQEEDKHSPMVGDLDKVLISLKLQKSLEKIFTDIKGRRFSQVPEATRILFDVNTAANNIFVSNDLKTASRTERKLSREETLDRFMKDHVLSIQSFSSGRYYWEVECSGSWRFGVTYSSLNREECVLGTTRHSWCLRSYNTNPDPWRKTVQDFQLKSLTRNIGIYLDYEAGRLSFYELDDPITHLHTFTATFTEPLHAAFGIHSNSFKILN